MLVLLLFLLVIPSATFTACFVICMMRSHTTWSQVHWLTVGFGSTFFVWVFPVALVVLGLVEAVLGKTSETVNVIAFVSVASTATAVLLGLATRSFAVAIFTVIAGAVACFLLNSQPMSTNLDYLSAIQATIAWQVVVCVSLIAWMISTLRNKPWLGKPMFCRTCGYDMHGSPTPICPECGTNLISRKKPRSTGAK